MTDITELAQRLKLEVHRAVSNFNPQMNIKTRDLKELVEALEKAQGMEACWKTQCRGITDHCEELQQRISELEPIRAAAEKLVRCKGRYHSEQNYRALAALFGVTTPDLPPLEHENVHYADAADMEIAALRQRIAGLEESNAQVIQSRDHYKRMTEEGLKQLAESRTVTVKQGEVLVTVAGFTGCGKSAIAGEIEIAMNAIGVPVTWANGEAEKRMTGADWLTAIEMYKPTVRIVEENIPRAADIKVEAE